MVPTARPIAVKPATNRVFIANHNSGTVSIVNAATNTLISNLDVGTASDPNGVAFNPTTATFYVANEPPGTVSIISAHEL